MSRLKDARKQGEIHKAALKVVLEKGLSGLVMSEVAREAGVAVGTLYIYYKTKEELLKALYDLISYEQGANFYLYHVTTGNFFEKLKYVWLAYFNYCYEHPEKMLFVIQYITTGITNNKAGQLNEGLMQPIINSIAEAAKDGLIVDIDARLIFNGLVGDIHQKTQYLVKYKVKPTEALKVSLFEMAMNSLLPQSSGEIINQKQNEELILA